MYNARNTADVIKDLLFRKKITARRMCSDCELSMNTIPNMRRGDIKSIETFYKIADYLNVSVDYLLGRTNNPVVNTDTPIINNGSITGDIDHNNGTVNVNSNGDIAHTISKDEAQLLQLYDTMDIRQRVKLLNIALEIADSKQEN